MSNLTYERILSESDIDIPLLRKIYQKAEIFRYLNISDNYFQYVTNTPEVYFYKVYLDNKLVGATHIEKQGSLLFMSILVFPDFQKKGLGTKIIKDIQADIFGLGYDKIKVAIDKTNIASLQLFEKAGFVRVSNEDELINFEYFIV